MKNLILFLLLAGTLSAKMNISSESMDSVFQGKTGGIILIDAKTGEEVVYNDSLINKRTTPCSTFKIWNALFGIESGILSSPDQPFWSWDSVSRDIVQWNKDLNLRESFQASCVPAFQNLARLIGEEKMKSWVDTLNYGDKNVSSGIDDFWLPRKNKESIKISPREQAMLLQRLIKGEIPVKESSVDLLKELMRFKSTNNGTLFGKTGSGSNIDGIEGSHVGWYVGFVESQGTTIVFAAILNGTGASGAEVRGMVEQILIKSNLL